MVTTNQKSTLDTHTNKKNIPNTTQKIVIKAKDETAKEEKKKDQHNISKRVFYMAIETYI